MPGPLSQIRIAKTLRRRRWVEDEFGAAAAGIAEGVARQFGNRGRDPGLVLAFKSQQFGQAMRALTHGDDVALVFDRHGHDRPDFGDVAAMTAHHFATSTVASSRCRVKSR